MAIKKHASMAIVVSAHGIKWARSWSFPGVTRKGIVAMENKSAKALAGGDAKARSGRNSKIAASLQETMPHAMAAKTRAVTASMDKQPAPAVTPPQELALWARSAV